VGRTFRFIGLAVLAGATWFLVAGEVKWISRDLGDQWFLPLAKVGGATFVLGMILGLLSPILRRLRQGHCTRCGAATEKGQSYCLDHLASTVQEAQDEIRRGETYRSR
jgi:hypothetical protein